MSKICAFCATPLTNDRSRFEVRVAPGATVIHEPAPGTYCGVFCWEAARVAKTVQACTKSLISDAETVLGEDGKLMRV